ncbi:MAG: hypothetical protein ACO25L_05875 [Candidatus Nanopelagicales bacterium]
MEINLNNLGKQFKFSRRISVKPTETLSEKEMFVDLITRLDEAWDSSNKLFAKFKINLLEYEEGYFGLIEDLLLMKYGSWKTEIILWFVYGRMDENGEIHPLSLNLEGNEEKVIIKTPTQLWDLLNRIENYKTK